MTLPDLVQEMTLTFTPAQRTKAAPYLNAILAYAKQQDDMILQLAIRPRVVVDLTAAPANLKLSDA